MFSTPIGLGIHFRSCRKCTDCKGTGKYTVCDDDGDAIGDVDCKWCSGTGKKSAAGMSLTQIEEEVGIEKEMPPQRVLFSEADLDAIRADARAQRDREIVADLRAWAEFSSIDMEAQAWRAFADAIERGEVP